MDNISNLYQQELLSLYQEISELSRQSKANEQLDGLLENPHITRLIQAFGLLTSNLTLLIDEASTQTISELFDILYPHYNRHIPSIAVVSILPNQKDEFCIDIPKGNILEMEVENVDKNLCKFQTCYDSEIVPLKIDNAVCKTENVIVDLEDFGSSLNIQLSTLGKTPLAQLGIKKIRFLIKGFDKEEYSIYYNLTANLDSIIIRCPKDHGNFITLNSHCIKQLGFSNENSLLPYPANSFPGYRLITEFFNFPEKFLFFDLILQEVDFSRFKNSIEICFCSKSKDLVGVVSKDNFVLNAVPVINLIEVESDPIEIDPNLFSYPLIMDKKNTKNYEVYSVEDVKVSVNNQEVSAGRLVDLDYKNHYAKNFWYNIKGRYAVNNPKQDALQYISILDSKGNLLSKSKFPKYFYVRALCSNGNLPNTLYTTNKAIFRFSDATIPVNNVKCVTAPTPKDKIAKNIDNKRRLTAHLSLNYLNILNNDNGKELLREVLYIYADNSKLSSRLINSIVDVKVSDHTSLASIAGVSEFYKGNIVEIYFDHNQLPTGFIYLFLNILEHFFAIYCSINSFVKLVARNKEGEVIYSGNPRNGSKCLI